MLPGRCPFFIDSTIYIIKNQPVSLSLFCVREKAEKENGKNKFVK
jgi:hypothetical protein